jgi:DNA invertase Pin-like site-specific DNA recombinase
VTDPARCAIYARFSSEKQNALSIDQQIRKCREYADRNNLRVLDGQIYSDEAISGRRMTAADCNGYSRSRSKSQPYSM